VVVAIIVLLAALLLPALKSAREKGKSAACVSNLRQLGIAFVVYAGDNDDYLPGYRNPGGLPNLGNDDLGWWQIIRPYAGDTTKLACATYRVEGYFNQASGGTYAINIQYGQYWDPGSGIFEWRPIYGRPRRITAHRAPSQNAYMVDRGGTPPDDVDAYFEFTFGLPGSLKYCAGFHYVGFNCLFMDQHVQWVNREFITFLPQNDAFWSEAVLGW